MLPFSAALLCCDAFTAGWQADPCCRLACCLASRLASCTHPMSNSRRAHPLWFAAGTTQQSGRRPRLPTFYDIAWLKPLLFIVSGAQLMLTLRDIIITGIPKFFGTPAKAWHTVRSGQTPADCLLMACTCCDRHPWPWLQLESSLSVWSEAVSGSHNCSCCDSYPSLAREMDPAVVSPLVYWPSCLCSCLSSSYGSLLAYAVKLTVCCCAMQEATL